MFFHALRTSVPSLGTDALFQHFDHATHDPFSHSASFRPHTVTCRALQHSLGTARRRSFPPLNLHRARVRRKSQAASFKSLYRKRANTPRSRTPLLHRASDTTLGLLARSDFWLARDTNRIRTTPPRRDWYRLGFVKYRRGFRINPDRGLAVCTWSALAERLR